MAHNINFNEQTGQHSFFSVKQKAWHGLGQIVEEYPTSKEALQFAGLDYEVIKSPLFTQSRAMTVGNEGELIAGIDIAVPNYYATMRTDNNTVLGVVGRDYSIVQNRDAFSFFDAIVGGDGMQYETAGALGNGERIFITAKLPGYIKVGKDDYIEKYLFLTTSHDGSGSITAAFTPVRIVCQNTLGVALRNRSNTIKIRHTANAEDRLKEAHKVMGISNKMADELDSIFNQWTKVRITDKDVMKLIQQAMAPSKEVLKSLKTGEELSTVFKNICDNRHRYPRLEQLAFVAIGNRLHVEQENWIRENFPGRKFTLVFGKDLIGHITDIKLAAGIKNIPIRVFFLDNEVLIYRDKVLRVFNQEQISLHAFQEAFGIRPRFRTAKPVQSLTFLDQLKHDAER